MGVGEHLLHHAAHKALEAGVEAGKQAIQGGGCIVTLVAILTGVGTLFTIMGLVFFA